MYVFKFQRIKEQNYIQDIFVVPPNIYLDLIFTNHLIFRSKLNQDALNQP